MVRVIQSLVNQCVVNLWSPAVPPQGCAYQRSHEDLRGGPPPGAGSRVAADVVPLCEVKCVDNMHSVPMLVHGNVIDALAVICRPFFKSHHLTGHALL